MRYIVLSSPRTGSTMLAEALNATGKAGVVREFFHRDELTRSGNPEQTKERMLSYYADIVNSTASADGVFGMKLHFNQFFHVFGGERIGMGSGLSFVKSFDRHVLIYRRDKILQAVSEWLAERTGVWTSDDRTTARSADKNFSDEDLPLLTRIMNRQVSEEYAWRSLLEDCSVRYHQIAYEDLAANPDAELERLAAYLAIPGLDRLTVTQKTVKLTDPTATAAIKQRVLAGLGVIAG